MSNVSRDIATNRAWAETQMILDGKIKNTDQWVYLMEQVLCLWAINGLPNQVQQFVTQYIREVAEEHAPTTTHNANAKDTKTTEDISHIWQQIRQALETGELDMIGWEFIIARLVHTWIKNGLSNKGGVIIITYLNEMMDSIPEEFIS